MEKENIKKLVAELIALGENKAELEVMLDIYDALDDEAKLTLEKIGNIRCPPDVGPHRSRIESRWGFSFVALCVLNKLNGLVQF